MACNDPAHANNSDVIQSIASATEKGKSFGEGIRLISPPISLKDALEKNLDKDGEVVVKAKVDRACESKGCWMILKDGDLSVRVTFKDYSFYIPKGIAKKMATVQGKLFSKTVSPAEQRHYLKDDGASKKEIAKITKPLKQPWFESTGLVLE